MQGTVKRCVGEGLHPSPDCPPDLCPLAVPSLHDCGLCHVADCGQWGSSEHVFMWTCLWGFSSGLR